MHPDTAHRGRLLYVALGFLGLEAPPAARPPELQALHAWLDSWHGAYSGEGERPDRPKVNAWIGRS